MGYFWNKAKSAAYAPSPWSTSNAKSIRTRSWNVDDGKLVNEQTDIGITYDPSKEAAENFAVDSTAIQSARYDPSDNSLNIVYRNGNGKEYKFSATPDEAQEWLDAPSKGRITQVWRDTNRYPGY